MAIDRSTDFSTKTTMSTAALREDRPFGYAGSSELRGKNEKDAERLGSATRKYVRIGPAVSATADSDFDSDKDGVGRQIELEADAAIKYRTCSWQKVGPFFAPCEGQSPGGQASHHER